MIKTVSFAAPRAASGAKPSSPVAARQAAIRGAKARVQIVSAPEPAAQPTLASLFPSPETAGEISASQARQQLQRAAAKPKKSSPTSSQPVSHAAPASAKRLAQAAAEPSLDLFAVESAPATPEAKPERAATQAAPAKKTRRSRVPANLAEQYGQNTSKRVESGIELPSVEDEAPKKRLNRAERAARRELMNPDDDLRARLHRAHNSLPLVKAEKRPRGWRFDCGRCGRTSYFQTSGAICNCGALALKD